MASVASVSGKSLPGVLQLALARCRELYAEHKKLHACLEALKSVDDGAISRLVDSERQLQQEVSALRSVNQRLREAPCTACAELNACLIGMGQEKAQLESKIKEQKQAMAAMAKQLEQEHAKSEELLRGHQEDLAQKDAEIADLTAQLVDSKARRQEIVAKAAKSEASLRDQLAEAQQTVAGVRKEVESVVEMRDHLLGVVDSANRENSDLKTQVEHLQAELERGREVEKKLRADRDALVKKFMAIKQYKLRKQQDQVGEAADAAGAPGVAHQLGQPEQPTLQQQQQQQRQDEDLFIFPEDDVNGTSKPPAVAAASETIPVAPQVSLLAAAPAALGPEQPPAAMVEGVQEAPWGSVPGAVVHRGENVMELSKASQAQQAASLSVQSECHQALGDSEQQAGAQAQDMSFEQSWEQAHAQQMQDEAMAEPSEQAGHQDQETAGAKADQGSGHLVQQASTADGRQAGQPEEQDGKMNLDREAGQVEENHHSTVSSEAPAGQATEQTACEAHQQTEQVGEQADIVGSQQGNQSITSADQQAGQTAEVAGQTPVPAQEQAKESTDQQAGAGEQQSHLQNAQPSAQAHEPAKGEPVQPVVVQAEQPTQAGVGEEQGQGDAAAVTVTAGRQAGQAKSQRGQSGDQQVEQVNQPANGTAAGGEAGLANEHGRLDNRQTNQPSGQSRPDAPGKVVQQKAEHRQAQHVVKVHVQQPRDTQKERPAVVLPYAFASMHDERSQQQGQPRQLLPWHQQPQQQQQQAPHLHASASTYSSPQWSHDLHTGRPPPQHVQPMTSAQPQQSHPQPAAPIQPQPWHNQQPTHHIIQQQQQQQQPHQVHIQHVQQQQQQQPHQVHIQHVQQQQQQQQHDLMVQLTGPAKGTFAGAAMTAAPLQHVGMPSNAPPTQPEAGAPPQKLLILPPLHQYPHGSQYATSQQQHHFGQPPSQHIDPPRQIQLLPSQLPPAISSIHQQMLPPAAVPQHQPQYIVVQGSQHIPAPQQQYISFARPPGPFVVQTAQGHQPPPQQQQQQQQPHPDQVQHHHHAEPRHQQHYQQATAQQGPPRHDAAGRREPGMDDPGQTGSKRRVGYYQYEPSSPPLKRGRQVETHMHEQAGHRDTFKQRDAAESSLGHRRGEQGRYQQGGEQLGQSWPSGTRGRGSGSRRYEVAEQEEGELWGESSGHRSSGMRRGYQGGEQPGRQRPARRNYSPERDPRSVVHYGDIL